jgi:hypothetical protein
MVNVCRHVKRDDTTVAFASHDRGASFQIQIQIQIAIEVRRTPNDRGAYRVYRVYRVLTCDHTCVVRVYPASYS